jgi:hypothetical protein
MTRYITIAIMLLTVSAAHASDIACGDSQQVLSYGTTRDPSEVTPGCFVIPEDQTQAQRTLVQSVSDKRYLKMDNGLVALKTGQDKTDVDTIIAAENAAKQVIQDAINDGVCQATFAQITTFLQQDAAQVQADIDAGYTQSQASIDAATNIATAKTAMSTMNTTSKTSMTTMKGHIYGILQRVIKCMLARTGGLQQ